MLPKLPNKDGITKWRSAEFRGIRHVPGAGNGDIYDCKGVTADDYPVLRTVDWTKRKYDSAAKGVYGSYQYGTAEAQRVYVNDGALYLLDTEVLRDKALTTVQRIVGYQRYALMLPFKYWIRTDVSGVYTDYPANPREGDVIAILQTDYMAWYEWREGEYTGYEWWETEEPPEDPEAWPIYHSWNNIPDGDPDGYMFFYPPPQCYLRKNSEWVSVGALLGPMDLSITTECTFIDGTYAGEPAEANTIFTHYVRWGDYFSVGDAVTISGSSYGENNKTLIIREIEDDAYGGHYLRFYENSFTDNSTDENITIARTVPDLDFLCVNENRVWGCKGQTIYASKLGDFRNWNVFDGLASDSYAVDVLTEGDFTGCVSFMGYPVFFKRRGIYKVYGNKPSNFEVTPGADTGCVCGDTLAIAGETLYYLSTRGVMSYNGGIPQVVSGDLGSFITGAEAAWAVSDGNIYYFFYLPAAGDTSTPVFEFDPAKGMWHKQVYAESYAGKLSYAYRGHKGAVFVGGNGYRYGDITALTNMSRAWEVEFADFTEESKNYPAYGANKKGTSKIQVRMELGVNSTCTISMKFDSTGDWITVKSFTTANVKKSFYLPIIPRRSDHFRIKFSGTGDFILWSLARESYKGSAL